MVRIRGEGPVEDMQLRGAQNATASPEAVAAIGAARAIVIGPSNPIISIGPILAVPGMRDALAGSSAPVVAVSPIVDGASVKGPTEPFMSWAGLSLDATGIAACYDGLLDGLVADEPCDALPVLRTDTLMRDARARERVAAETLRFAEGLA